MKVRMKTLITGTTDGEPWPQPGGVIEVSDQAGADLCANGYAEPVAEKPEKRAEKRTSSKKKSKSKGGDD